VQNSHIDRYKLIRPWRLHLRVMRSVVHRKDRKMKRNQITALGLAIGVGACSLAALAGVEVKAEKENVVASRLIGEWKTHTSLSGRLVGSSVREKTITFAEDKSVAAKVPEAYSEYLKGKQVYLAGIMTRAQKTYPFILTEYNGNPYIFYFREKNGDPMGGAESFNLVIAPAKDRAQDLLFIGGDFNNQPFSAFERVD
jgi:hypothetical protein